MAKHIHCYERVKGKPQIYRCIHPDCNHYCDKRLLLWKRALCLCGKEFILERDQLKLKTPHCNNCVLRNGNGFSISQDKIAEALATPIKHNLTKAAKPRINASELIPPSPNDSNSMEGMSRDDFASMMDEISSESEIKERQER